VAREGSVTLRDRLVDAIAQHVRDARVLDALRAVDRAEFVPPAHRRFPYEDTALPIGEDQTIS